MDRVYSGTLDGAIRDDLEEVLASWQDVRRRKVFGHPAYLTPRGMFAFLTDAGVAVGRLSPDEEARVTSETGAAPFEHAAGKRRWLVVPVASPDDLGPALTWTRVSYERLEGMG